MADEPHPLTAAVQQLAEIVAAAEALLDDARMRNAHRVTDLAGTVQVGHDAMARLDKAMRTQPAEGTQT